MEWMYGVPWRSQTRDVDLVTDTAAQQVRSTAAYDSVGDTTRRAVRAADRFLTRNPSTTAGLRPQAVIITPTDAPSQVAQDIRTAQASGRGRRVPSGALPPEHVRGLPGRVGAFGAGLTVLGTGLSALSLYDDYERGDVPMGAGDALGTAGGGLELLALARPGATVLGFSAMSTGLVLGGAGIAIASGVAGDRAAQAGDTAGAVLGRLGVVAGLAIMAGVIFSAPLVLGFGLGLALGVGLIHLWRWFSS